MLGGCPRVGADAWGVSARRWNRAAAVKRLWPQRLWIRVGLAGVVGSLALTLAVALTVVTLPPLDLGRYQARSPIVTARGGELLYVALAPDERWRMHTTPAMVAPRYLEAL